MHHRLVGAIVGGWLVLQLSVVSGFGFLSMAVPLAVALGATSYGVKFARPALAITGGLMAGLLVATIGGLVGVGLVSLVLAAAVTVAVTAILWVGQSGEALPIGVVPDRQRSR
jgi:hypothetical protein